jgi:hypothetical protein
MGLKNEAFCAWIAFARKRQSRKKSDFVVCMEKV